MFDIFKSSQSTKEVIEKIHREFFTAGEILLAEAQAILSKPSTLEHKAQRLESLGFKLAKGVREAKEMIAKRAMTQEIASLIQYYQGRYPNSKFITQDMVDKICKKYNLICAPIENFIGFVPEKNLIEAEEFDFKIGDKAIPRVKVIYNDEKRDAKGIKVIRNRYPDDLLPKALIREMWASTGYVEGFGHRIRIDSYKEAVSETEKQICAPAKDFDLSGLEKFKNSFQKMQVKTFPDPVMLQPCNGGFLIITAWGDEASDELVVNHKMN